ncbi:MAG: ABC transporter permease [Micrococcales bacterium]|uniref:ABC transporter permease n=1 Tax=Phycicoccus sp. TaxID=1902410 RepID=UPI0019CA79BF|nr:ABC transporter permease [Phycicoccus sp.]MBD3783880.1 ABC transporter permease [Micrococcales bacterium]HMM96401.1 ABC transporter permease [Phycicoccus sp.]
MSDTSTAEQTPPAEQEPGPEPRDRGGLLAYLIAHQSGVVIVVALVIALVIGAGLIRYQGVSPVYAYETLVREALVVPGSFTRTLQKTAPLVLTGLAVVLPLRVGLFNIGGQGQLVTGALLGAWVAYVAGGLGFGGAVLGMVVGLLAGAAIGWLVGVLKAWRGVHEVISTIMLNYIVAGVAFWGVSGGPFQGEASKTSGIPQSELIPESAQLHSVLGIPIGFVVAFVLAVACWWVLSRTTLGFRFNTVGANRDAARYAGIPLNRIVVLSMVAGGGLAGLAGALEAEGTLHRFEPAIGGSLGFDGITIALLARANPLATIPAAFLVGMLRTGAAGLQFATQTSSLPSGITPEIVDLLLAIILLMVSIPVLGKWLFRSRAAKVSVASTSWGS